MRFIKAPFHNKFQKFQCVFVSPGLKLIAFKCLSWNILNTNIPNYHIMYYLLLHNISLPKLYSFKPQWSLSLMVSLSKKYRQCSEQGFYLLSNVWWRTWRLGASITMSSSWCCWLRLWLGQLAVPCTHDCSMRLGLPHNMASINRERESSKQNLPPFYDLALKVI